MSETKMRRVYHFVNSEYGLQNVQMRRLKISTLLGLNDPFELLSNNIRNKKVRSLFNIAKSIFDKRFGIICFSNSSQSPVQWAHYADRNRGVCLGFDVRSDSLIDIKYIDERVNEASFPKHPDHAEEWMRQILSTKYSQWAYEDESRCFFNLETKTGEYYFKEFDSDIVLKEVQVGFHSEITRAELSEKLGALSGTVSCFRVRPAFGSFHMVRNENESLWK
ncbi:Protein of unknown function [Pseudomonas koreensis]|uniref:DUF2971 domain-containing protein n=1 Tax=Pseudomonas koreensis TaxID=198620 RepID=UPI00087C20C3|nr:DUF2971 domain-containing protein [Pseudomonas koreensis]KAB0510897.1 DUF2971 domain-containing protein [Pseudomonas koreensis]NNA64357.1 DUF2971 domain-containing protein [Pseudomonas koreensis]GGK52899.1 hypothetical protein GCM10009103_54060 [Pseudomonas koreensis]SDE19224.1 Protein of unknown function [Pseudomonas koreensis]